MKAYFASLRVACCLIFIFFTLCAAEPKIEKLCPQVLPDGPASKNRFETQGRVINGNIARKLRPYMGALRSFSELVCSATLISEQWALTAGHCAFDPNRTKFVTGGNEYDSGVEIDIEKGIVHELFPLGSESNIINDIQLIKLKTPVPSTARFVKLNTKGSIPAPHAFVRTAGYGETLGTATPRSGVLRQVDVPVQPMSVCKRQYGVDINIFRAYHICAGYVRGGCDSCSGDSGGPLFIFDDELNVVQVGIVSFGFDCALPNASGVYTRLSSQIEWVQRKGAKFETTGKGVNVFKEPENGSLVVKPNREVSENSKEVSTSPTPPSGPSPALALAPAPGPASVAAPTPAPTPTLVAATGDSQDAQVTAESDSQCFPGSAEVTLKNGFVKQMRDLKIGDSVKVGPERYSEVFMFTHKTDYGIYKFVRVRHAETVSSYSSSRPSSIVLTQGHLLLLNGVYSAANSARVGDVLELGDGRQSVVTEVDTVWERGLYNAQTVDGRIVVNGVVASAYTTAIDFYTAHAVLAPLRCAFHLFGMDLTRGVLEKGF